MMRKTIHKYYIATLLIIGIATGIQSGPHSFSEGNFIKINLSKNLSGHEGQWTKEKRYK